MNRMRIKKSGEDIFIDIFAYTFMTFLTIVTLLPFMNVVSKALSAEWAVVAGKVNILPVGFNLNSLKLVVSSSEFLRAFWNSSLTTVVGTVLTLLITAMTAYPLSKRQMPGMRIILFLFVFTMFFSGGMIPTYLLIKNLHMMNKLSSIIIPGLINIFHMLIVKNF
jgi:putative aldouronate transport system permease protein